MMDQAISDVYAELSNLVNTAYTKIADKVLIKTQYGIVVYNKYVIRRIPGGVEVIPRNGVDILKFSNAKHALIWTILDHNNLVYESKRMMMLDCLLSSAQIDAEIHRRGKSKGDLEQHLIHFSKLQHALARQKQFLYEIDKYSIMARKCQEKGTKHENQ